MRLLRAGSDDWEALDGKLYVPVYEISDKTIPDSQEDVAWEAIAVTDRETGEQVVLGFTGSREAMLFLRDAVKFGLLNQAYKIGQFSVDRVEEWEAAVLLDPDPDDLYTDLPRRYEIPGGSLPLDTD